MPHPIRGGIPTDQSRGLVTLELRTDDGTVSSTFEFPVNPEDISIDRPSRQTVTQTLTGTYQDHLGQGLMKVRIRGHTGWRQLKAQYADGFAAYKALRDLLYQYDQTVAKSDPSKVHLRLLLDIPSGWEHFLVSKENATFMRSKSQPLLFRYELDFVVLSDQLHDPVVDPSPAFIINLPSTPPPAIVVTLGPGDTDTGPTNDHNNDHSNDSEGLRGPDEDDYPTDIKGPAAVAKGAATTYEPEWFSTAELYDMGVSTISALAAYVYGIAGWQNPAKLWTVIAMFNPQYFTNATANSPLPKGGQTGDSRAFNDAPVMIRVPKILGAAWDYDSNRYTAVNVGGQQHKVVVPTHENPTAVQQPVFSNPYLIQAKGLADVITAVGDFIGDFIGPGYPDTTFIPSGGGGGGGMGRI